MNKSGVFVLLAVFVFFFSISFVAAEINQTKTEQAYACLEGKVTGRCSQLSIQEMAFTVLASPTTAVSNECRDALKLKNCAGGTCTMKEAALAILALRHVGEDTKAIEAWLIAQNRTPSDLVWFLEQDSADSVACRISYGGENNNFLINVDSSKKIDQSAGECLSLDQSNFWLRISSSCYDKDFAITCDKPFTATLLYRQQNSPTIYVSSNAPSAQASGTITLKVKAKCFAASGNSCDYEGTAWATLALLKANYNIAEYVPYLMALSEVDANRQYLPNAFIYAATAFDDYGTRLIKEQTLGFWEVSGNGRFYDTALALLVLQSSTAEPVTNAKNKLMFDQENSGCWNKDSVRDTAFILYSLLQKTSNNPTISTTSRCPSSNFCILNDDCPTAERLTNYYCEGVRTCCQTENLKACSTLGGSVCKTGEFCAGEAKKASDTASCCLAQCEESTTTEPVRSACEISRGICRTECESGEEAQPTSCTSARDVCCQEKTGGLGIWFWLLIGILILVLIIAFLMRDRLKLMWFKRGVQEKPVAQSTMPPRPGFPPVRRPMQPMPMRRPLGPASISSYARQPLPRPGQNRPMDDTFRKLREMSKK